MAIAKPLPMSVGKYVKVIKGRQWDGTAYVNDAELSIPLKWKSPRVVFVCSMGDLFFEEVPFRTIYDVYLTIQKCPQHIFIILTKRPERMLEFYTNYAQIHDFIDNIWIGVTAENQETANERIHYLNNIPAAVKFVSIEPMLSAIDFEEALGETLKWHAGGLKNCLSWIICGGESGSGARPMHPDWVRSLRDQCQKARVPFFFKQWGEWMPTIYGGQGTSEFNWCEKGESFQWMCRVGRKESGNLLDGVKYEEYPSLETRNS